MTAPDPCLCGSTDLQHWNEGHRHRINCAECEAHGRIKPNHEGAVAEWNAQMASARKRYAENEKARRKGQA